ncbi:homing endonuclease associated repeat-containing protein [Natrononativus amylolyticus]|uniref:homing endonuclease associated repeat-containing protein n=1 Tax=Natrononativus amylolyticus TaxID=2963434 RepID=UPI003CE4CD42
MATVYTEADCIASLREATREVGKSPTQAEYRGLDFSPCVTHICDIAGGWNDAKKAADIETYDQVGEAYDHVPLYPDSSGYERWYIRTKGNNTKLASIGSLRSLSSVWTQ